MIFSVFKNAPEPGNSVDFLLLFLRWTPRRSLALDAGGKITRCASERGEEEGTPKQRKNGGEREREEGGKQGCCHLYVAYGIWAREAGK